MSRAIHGIFTGFIYGGLAVIGCQIFVQMFGVAALIVMLCILIVALPFANFILCKIRDKRFEVRRDGKEFMR